MVIEDNDMDAFIRATLNENQRVRETRNAPVLQAVLSRATTTIAGAPISLSSPVTKMRGDVLGGGGGGCNGFELTAGGTASALKVNVSSSTIAGQEPSGFTAGSKEFSVSASGVIYAQVTVNSTTGAITARALNNGSSRPANTATVFHEQIGTYTVTGTGDARSVSVSNSRCGPVSVNICRNWYAAKAPFFGVSIS